MREPVVGLLEASLNSRLTAKDLQEDMADSGIVGQFSATPAQIGPLWKSNQKKTSPHHKTQHLNFAKDHLDKLEAFWKQVLWTDEVRIELFGCNEQRYCMFGEQRAQFHETNICPTVKHGGGIDHALGLYCS